MMIQSKLSIMEAGLKRHLISLGAKLNGLPKRPLLSLTLLAMILLLFGCGKDPEADATAELAASFEDSPAKDNVIKANTAFKEGRYKDSLYLLHKVASRGDLTERQKMAMVQLHRMMELLVLRTMGET